MKELLSFLTGGIIGNGPGGPGPGTSGEHVVDMPDGGETQPKVRKRLFVLV